MDAQSSPRAAVALAVLVQSLAAHEAQAPPRTWTAREVLMESMFRATRDGVGATLLHDGALKPVPEIAAEILARVTPQARELGGGDALEEVRWLLEAGGGAARQRDVHARRGMAGLLRFLVAETSGGERAGRLTALS